MTLSELTSLVTLLGWSTNRVTTLSFLIVESRKELGIPIDMEFPANALCLRSKRNHLTIYSLTELYNLILQIEGINQ